MDSNKNSFPFESKITLIAIEAALMAGGILQKGYGTNFEILSKKGRHNLVTEYDKLSEEKIISFIKEECPDHTFLAEEGGHSGNTKSPFQWVIDPLDGTVNFAHEIPMFAVSIAFRQDGVTVCGVVYQPITHELFVAEKGMGAYLNGRKLKVTDTKDFDQAIVATGFPYNLIENPKNCIQHFINVLNRGVPIRRLGVAAIDLAYLAAGRFDAFFEVALGPWDCAAGNLLVEEAGGKITQWNCDPFDIMSYKTILASNSHLHKEMSSILTEKPND